jgi:flagellar motor protein MotB
VTAVWKRHPILLFCALLAPPTARAQEVVEAPIGQAVERQLPGEEAFSRWSHDPELLGTVSSDRLERREVLAEGVETVKLSNLVPSIRFESGVANVPASYVERLRAILEDMGHLENVRLHLVGHADDQPLSEALAGIYGDNAGLSRERAGEVAEFLKTALSLPPEAISFEWAGDRQPIASNLTTEGRALNRRVEVEVWYDEVEDRVSMEEVVVPVEIRRIKVCRTETVCKLRYREGHEHRARVKNLVPPLRTREETVGIPDPFLRQVEQALAHLADKQNVAVRLVGFTDDAPLAEREERIYGTHLALSKARAHRVALALKEALDLPTSAIESGGRGASLPVASNETPQGRALNRRVEVEFWYDDPLQELPVEPQRCPDDPGAELVTKVYEPAWGPIEPLPLEEGRASIPPGYADELRRAMADVADKTHVRLRFVGYTRGERLDRRTAMVYGDDVGLSVARARRTMERIQDELGLTDPQVEHEGRGFVHSSDVVNGGFLQGDTSHVAVEVVYDELAVLDDYEGVEVIPLTRELEVQNPLALNLMRITVDGEPLDDPGRSSADVQRCTDVALDQARIGFQFDNLEADRKLSIRSQPGLVSLHVTDDGLTLAPPVPFLAYTNYAHFIDRWEVRIFEKQQSVRSEPLAIVEVDERGFASWQPAPVASPALDLKYLLRAYAADRGFDETATRPLHMVLAGSADRAPRAGADEVGVPGVVRYGASETNAGLSGMRGPDPLLDGYGESELALRNIALGSVGAVRVQGSGVPLGHTVWVAGHPVPIDESGSFVAEALLPKGLHTVEVAVLDEAGNGELFLRDLEFLESDWFYVGMADVTLAAGRASGPAEALSGELNPLEDGTSTDGRLAFFVNGKFGEDWKFVASADTRETPVEDLFSNFLDKSPEALFRRIDPDYHYPTFGDDATVEEMAPTLGRFYVKLNQANNHALWGNFKVGYLDNELAHVDRGLYGANLRYESDTATSFGEQRLVVDGFAAEPGTLGRREEFRATGGSLYFLGEQDLLSGSERVRVEVRDKTSGLVSSVVQLTPMLDYDIDYLQGRVLLSEPLSSTVDDSLLVRTGGLSGDEAWLVVQYEYTPGFDDVDAMATGGQAHYWLNDHVKLGLTANENNEERVSDSSLYAADLTVRRSADSWFKLQAGRSEGLLSSSLRSDDGGFSFLGVGSLPLANATADAYRADLNLSLGDFFDGSRGRVNLYAQNLDAGYSAPGHLALTDTKQFGGSFRIPVTQRLKLAGKADRLIQDRGLETTAQEFVLRYQLTERWSLGSGLRNELREDHSPIVLPTQQQGERTDALMQLAYDSRDRWRGYGFAQSTLRSSGTMEDNGRIGVGGAYRLNDRLHLDGEVSHGDLGLAGKLGTTYQQSERTNLYLSYTLQNERADSGLKMRTGNLVSGARSRLSDSASVYLEDRYQHTDWTTGLTQAAGINLAPAKGWSLGVNWDLGTLTDRQTGAETRRRAGGGRIGFGSGTIQLSSAIEYRFDETELLGGGWSDRTTWLFRNTLKFQLTPDWRLVGKLNHADSESSLGQLYDGGYTEAVFGYAYRPVSHDRLNALLKYTYFFNLPTTDQALVRDISAQFVQRSHIASLDLTYDLTGSWSLGGKYAYRLGQVSLDREHPDFFDNNAHLYILRSDWRFLKDWEATVEMRILDVPDLTDRRSGALVSLYRYLGEHFKVGVGYNFTDFSEDLTDLSYDHHGLFVNLVGTF